MRLGYRLLWLFAFTAVLSLGLRWFSPTEERRLVRSTIEGEWTAQEIDGSSVVTGANTEEVPRVLLDDVQLSGSYGCKRFSSTYLLSGGEIQLSDMVEETAFCDGEYASSDPAYLSEVFNDIIGDEDIEVFVEDGLMVWATRSHEVIFARN